LIDDHYHDNPEKFVRGLHRVGIATPLDLDIPGAGKPNIRIPNKDLSNWSRTALAWMSIGYETQIPPINTLAFYNAIANNGVMVKPRFVKSIVKDGQVVEDIAPEILNPAIASPKAISEIQTILEKVVSEGLGKKAGSKQFHVSGKTGTAQVSQGKAGYTNGTRRYLVSFCGYFPSEAPKYSCIVAIQKPGLPASGGLMAGSVFSKIAERVFAKHLAQEAVKQSDKVIITSDNPRFEEPQEIINDMLAGLTKEDMRKVISIADRKEAIRTACMLAQAKDVILVAGKGHENYQEIKGIKHHFDDKEVLRDIFANE
jgi:cell division protein FtsI (penicillin-binding protein 3)